MSNQEENTGICISHLKWIPHSQKSSSLLQINKVLWTSSGQNRDHNRFLRSHFPCLINPVNYEKWLIAESLFNHWSRIVIILWWPLFHTLKKTMVQDLNNFLSDFAKFIFISKKQHWIKHALWSRKTFYCIVFSYIHSKNLFLQLKKSFLINFYYYFIISNSMHSCTFPILSPLSQFVYCQYILSFSNRRQKCQKNK